MSDHLRSALRVLHYECGLDLKAIAHKTGLHYKAVWRACADVLTKPRRAAGKNRKKLDARK